MSELGDVSQRVAKELLALMRTRGRIDRGQVSHYPALTAAPRVQTIARENGYDLGTYEGLRQALTHVLEDRRADELRLLAEADDDERLHFRPTALPALHLLALIGNLARGVGDRDKAAARERYVGYDTMRQHHKKQIADEVAELLIGVAEPAGSEEAAYAGADRDAASSLLSRVERVSDQLFYIVLISDGEVTAEGSLTPNLEYACFQLLRDLYAPLDEPEAETCLARGWSSTERLRELAQLPEGDERETGVAYASALEIGMRGFPRFTHREEDVLEEAARSAGDSMHRFLRILETDPVGESAHRRWHEWLRETSPWGTEGGRRRWKTLESAFRYATQLGRLKSIAVVEAVISPEIRPFLASHPSLSVEYFLESE